MSEMRALCLLGGTHHDFGAAEAFFAERLPQLGVRPSFARDPAALGRISHSDTDLVFNYSCMGEAKLDDIATANLVRFVELGGGVFAMHGATVSFAGNAAYAGLIGARFTEHPKTHNFTVMPMRSPHPVTAGVEAFTVRDELYIQECAPDIRIHMVAAYLNVAQPMVWTRTQGAGRVCYVALGHDLSVWQRPPVWQLVANGVHWVVEEEGDDEIA